MRVATARLAVWTAGLAPGAQVVQTTALAQGGSKPLQMWVGSETDAGYYRKMVDLYRARKKPGFAAEVSAYGYTEMPDKLAVAIKTGANPPDIVQLDEIFFSLYLRGEGQVPERLVEGRETGASSTTARRTRSSWRCRWRRRPSSPREHPWPCSRPVSRP